MSERIKKACRRYQIEMIAASGVYATLLVGAKLITKSTTAPPLRLLLAVAPVFPIIYGCIAFVQYYFTLDERDRRVAADAAAVTLMVAIVSLLTVGFLRLFEVIAFEPDLVLITAVMIIFWGLARIVISNRR